MWKTIPVVFSIFCKIFYPALLKVESLSLVPLHYIKYQNYNEAKDQCGYSHMLMLSATLE